MFISFVFSVNKGELLITLFVKFLDFVRMSVELGDGDNPPLLFIVVNSGLCV